MKVKEFMDSYSQDIIRELGKKEFNTTDVVFTINQRKGWQEEYIKLSNEYGSYNKLNAQIGRYLGNNQKKMGICKDGDKEVSISITGRRSPNQKWKVLLVPFLLLFMSISVYAQTLTPQQNSKSKWGYVNETGKAVIKHKYDEARAFSEELAAVKIYDKKSASDKWGFIDRTGKVIVSLKYDGGVGDFTEGIARVRSNGKIGWIDRTGTEFIPLIYDETSPFIEGWAMVEKNGKLGFIDKTGKEIIPIKYNEIGNFSEEGVAKVREGYYWGFIDKTGKEIIPVKYNEIGEFSETGLAKVREGNNWGFIDKIGKEIIPVKYDEIGDFSREIEGLAKVKIGGNWGFIDKTGKEIIPVKYDEISAFSKEGLAKVKGSGNSWWAYGFIDKAGNLIIPLKYYGASDFSNGYAAVKYYDKYREYNYKTYWNEIWGVVDKTGKEVLPGEYLEQEALNMILDRALLQKEVQRKQEEKSYVKMLIEEVESALENDYYSNNCPTVEKLEELREKLKKLEKELPFDFGKSFETKIYLLKLQTRLSEAISTQLMTKKYGAATAKKIMAGKYEIGMSKAVCREIAGINFAGVVNQTARTETWKVNEPGKRGGTFLFFEGDKLSSITY